MVLGVAARVLSRKFRR